MLGTRHPYRHRRARVPYPPASPGSRDHPVARRRFFASTEGRPAVGGWASCSPAASLEQRVVPLGTALRRSVLTAPRCCPVRHRVGRSAGSALGHIEPTSKPRYHDMVNNMSAFLDIMSVIRTINIPRQRSDLAVMRARRSSVRGTSERSFGGDRSLCLGTRVRLVELATALRVTRGALAVDAELGEQRGTCSRRACLEALHARTRRSSQLRGSGAWASVGDGSLRSARTDDLRDLGPRLIPADRPVPSSSRGGPLDPGDPGGTDASQVRCANGDPARHLALATAKCSGDETIGRTRDDVRGCSKYLDWPDKAKNADLWQSHQVARGHHSDMAFHVETLRAPTAASAACRGALAARARRPRDRRSGARDRSGRSDGGPARAPGRAARRTRTA